MKRLCPFLFLVLLSCQSTNSADPEVLKEVDRAFSMMSETKGMGEAFIAYADQNALILQNKSPTLMGIDEIRQAYSGYTKEKVKLTWEPIKAEISASGDLGYTHGKYTLTIIDSVDLVSHGRYLSVWKKQANGMWKYVVDTGAEDPKKGSTE